MSTPGDGELSDWDLIVVGAGPAGTAAALSTLYTDPRLRVLLLDRADFPRDKSCGDGIAPHVFDRLSRIGVSGVEDGWTPLTRLELARGSSSVARTMARPVYVIPREVFDARLVERAVAAGAALRPAPGRRDPGHRPGGRARRAVPRPGRGRRRRRAQRRPRSTSGMPERAPRARDPRLRADAARPPGHAGDPVRRPPPAVVRLGLRPRRRAVQRRVRRAAARRPHRRPAEPRRCCSTSSTGCCPGASRRGDQWKAHHLPLSTWRWDQPDGPVLLAGDAAGLINPMTGEGIYYAVATGIAAGRAAAQAYRADDPRPGRRLHRRAVHAGCSAGTSSTRGPRPGSPRAPTIVDAGIRAAAARTAGSSTSWSSWVSATAASHRGWPGTGRWRSPTTPFNARPRPAREGGLMQILSVRGALPPHRYPQAEITDAFASFIASRSLDERLMRRFHANAGVEFRSTVLPLEEYGAHRVVHPGQRPVHRARRRARRAGAPGRAEGRRPDAHRRRPGHLRDGHRARGALPRGADRRRRSGCVLT